MQPDHIYEWVIDVLQDERQVSQTALADQLDGQAEHAYFLLDVLVRRGLVTERRHGETVEYHVDAPAELDGAIDSFGHDSDEQRPDGLENALVANVPLDMEESFADLRDQHDVPVRLLRPTFEQLFADADETLLLAVPFFEQSGLNGLLDEVAALARNDVDVRVLTRDVIDPKDTGYNHLKKKRALAKLCDLYEANRRSPDASLSIKDFGDRMTSAEQASLQYRGVHQKMVVADTNAAYIGSGEIREASFLRNGEVGYLRTDTAEVAFWADFFELFWREAREVSSRHLNDV